jgi:hypothetical protein
LARDLRATGSVVDDEDLAVILIAGLKKEFDTLVTVLSMGDIIKLIDTVFPQLQTHEQMMKVHKGLSDSSIELEVTIAYAAKGGHGKKGACNKCGKMGHFSRECRSGNDSQSTRKQLKCYVCGSSDHLKRDCPKKESGKSKHGVAFAAGDFLGNSDSWLLDCGATEHMTEDQALSPSSGRLSRAHAGSSA